MLVNLTPHPVVFSDGRTLPKCDNPPRLAEVVDPAGEVDGVTIVCKAFDLIKCELPKEQSGTYYVVPLLIAQAFSSLRSDLLVTNDPIRDEEGRIIGCRSLARV
jgi:hypothetical protein